MTPDMKKRKACELIITVEPARKQRKQTQKFSEFDKFFEIARSKFPSLVPIALEIYKPPGLTSLSKSIVTNPGLVTVTLIGICDNPLGDNFVQHGPHLIVETVVIKSQDDFLLQDLEASGGGVTLTNSYGSVQSYLRSIWSRLTEVISVTSPNMQHHPQCDRLRFLEQRKPDDPVGEFGANSMPIEISESGGFQKVTGGFMCPNCLAIGTSLHFAWKPGMWNDVQKES